MLPAVTAAVAVLTMERSALEVTVVVAVGLLPNGLGSAVGVETFAVFVIVPEAPGLMCTVIENVADVTGNDPIEQVTVPVPPGAGLLHEKVGPVVCDSETNVVFGGTASVRETVAAAEGPLLVSVTV